MPKTSGVLLFIFGGTFFCFYLNVVVALKCYQCGQYNEGLGSITPCINETYMKLKECPRKDQLYCIKYVSEDTSLRDCVAKCTEKEDWGSKTFCCREDGCNAAELSQNNFLTTIFAILFILLFFNH